MSMHAFIVNSTHFSKPVHDPDILLIKETDIENIRGIATFLSQKPLKAKINTVIVENAHKLSIVAQNTMLKILEEPTGNAEIYLVTDFPNLLLPTILSRTQLVSTKLKKIYIKTNLENITTRDELLEYLDYMENEIHNNPQDLRPKIYDLVCETRKFTKANCNLKLCINHLTNSLHPFRSPPLD